MSECLRVLRNTPRHGNQVTKRSGWWSLDLPVSSQYLYRVPVMGVKPAVCFIF